MSKNDNLDSSLPEMTHDLVVDVEGKITKKRYLGEFACKIPTTKDQCLIAKHRAFLDGEYAQYLDVGTRMIHRKISYLRYTLTEYPKWWKNNDLGYELVDHNVIERVYDLVLEFEESWLKKVWGDEYEEGSRSDEEEEKLQKEA